MDANVFRILEYLAEVPVGTKRNVSDLMNEIFPKEVPAQDGNMIYFLQSLKPYTNYQDYVFRKEPEHGFVGFELRMTNDGLEALKKERDRLRQHEVGQSSIDVNNSIIATNKAIQNTDARMLEHAERQEVIMQTQSEFSRQQVAFSEQQVQIMDRQVGLVRTQNNLYRNTLVLTGVNILIGIIILIITIISGSEKQLISALQSQSIEQQKEIKRLQSLKSDTVHYVLHYPELRNKNKGK